MELNKRKTMSGSLSATGVAASASSTVDDEHHIHHESALAAADLNLIMQDRKDQSLLVLKSDLMAKLNKEVKSLDEDSWMFDGPRSRIHLISGSGADFDDYARLLISLYIDTGNMMMCYLPSDIDGGLRHRHTEISTSRDIALRK